MQHWPLNSQVHWLTSIPDRVSQPQASWITGLGSLTARLRQSCQQLEVQLLANQLVQANTDQQALLGASSLWCREVCLLGDKSAWVMAQSLWPEAALASRELRQLHTQPLGELLFSVAQPDDLCRQFCIYPSSDMALVARRSVYWYQRIPVLVQELFLPESPAYREAFNGQ
ncbi:chorismate--pyruvate lyase family protein [Celerinatantimonas yamalensis]|uniref:Probable chorismate pyruvate-lyase n=1 Tax=Celerinatantimonas yamalensis TaxID=559956 RepID=A0ABW9G9F9_9GAMM